MTRTSPLDRDIDALLTTKSRTTRSSKAREAKAKAMKTKSVRSRATATTTTSRSAISGTARAHPSPSSSSFTLSSPSKSSDLTQDSSDVERIDNGEVGKGPWGWRYLKEVHRDGIKTTNKLSTSVKDIRRHLNKLMIDIHFATREKYLSPSYNGVFQQREEDLSRCLKEACNYLLEIQTDLEVATNWVNVLQPLEDDMSSE